MLRSTYHQHGRYCGCGSSDGGGIGGASGSRTRVIKRGKRRDLDLDSDSDSDSDSDPASNSDSSRSSVSQSRSQPHRRVSITYKKTRESHNRAPAEANFHAGNVLAALEGAVEGVPLAIKGSDRKEGGREHGEEMRDNLVAFVRYRRSLKV